MRRSSPTSRATDETVFPAANNKINFARTTVLCGTTCERDTRCRWASSSRVNSIRIGVLLVPTLSLEDHRGIDAGSPLVNTTI